MRGNLAIQCGTDSFGMEIEIKTQFVTLHNSLWVVFFLKIYFDGGSNSYIFNGCQLTKCSRNEIQPIIQFARKFREMIYLLALLVIWTDFLAHLFSLSLLLFQSSITWISTNFIVWFIAKWIILLRYNRHILMEATAVAATVAVILNVDVCEQNFRIGIMDTINYTVLLI